MIDSFEWLLVECGKARPLFQNITLFPFLKVTKDIVMGLANSLLHPLYISLFNYPLPIDDKSLCTGSIVFHFGIFNDSDPMLDLIF